MKNKKLQTRYIDAIKWYEDHYTMYIIEDIYKTYPDNKKYIGDCKNKKCRFCGKDFIPIVS